MSSTMISGILLVILVLGLYIRELTRTTIIEYYEPGGSNVYKCRDLERYSRNNYEDRLFFEIIMNNGVSLGRFEATVSPRGKSFELKTESGNWYLEDTSGTTYLLTKLGIGMSN